MKTNKFSKHDLETARPILYLVGLSLSLFAFILVINWKTYELIASPITSQELIFEEEQMIQTFRSKPAAPPPPSVVSGMLEPVPELFELKIELMIDSVDPSAEEPLEEVGLQPEESDEVFNFAAVDKKPIFPGCESGKTEDERSNCFQENMFAHFSNKFRFPEVSRQAKSQGVIVVNFIIEKDGTVSSAKVLRGVDDALDAEALRVINQLPVFEPAKHKGRAVRMSFNMPINASMK